MGFGRSEVVTLREWQTIRHLASIGKSQRFIARTLGVSRRTVARVLQSETLPTYDRAPTVTQTLETFRPVIEPEVDRGAAGLRLLQSVRQSGYTGSDATFYRWLAGVRETVLRRGSACRFETGPGEQSQFDWSPYTLLLGNVLTPVILYAQVLGYSRRVHWYPSLSERQDSILEAIEEGWRHFGGACRFLLIDNARSMVLRHRASQVHWNDCFLGLCGHYRVQPIAHTPAHPQTKGKVENPFRTIETRLLEGSAWQDFEHFTQEVAAFEAAWEQRIHHTTRQAPAARFLDEKGELLALPKALFGGCPHHLRRLSGDGLFSYLGNRYCVPDHYPGRQVRIRTLKGRELVVLGMDGAEIIRHPLNPPGSPPAIPKECYEGNQRRRRAKLTILTAQLRSRYPQSPHLVDRYIERLLQHHPNRPETPLSRVLDLLTGVPEDVALSVLGQAAELGLPEPHAVEALLTRTLQGADPPLPTALPGQLTLPALDVERSLETYGRLLPAVHNGHGG
jgi:transposase